ncbi:ParA family partition ATPase [Elioraea tepidiphila]|uniref:ParA family partition ATPase n=1 Tax=Elioraea tepidiphila TaxID=457934 RepID=UPI002FDA2B6F
MRAIAIAGQKGGAGKTTLAVHLAVTAQASGLRVGVIDADPQGSASAWASARPAEASPLTVAALTGGDVRRGLEAARADGLDLVVVDTPPHASAATASALPGVDLVLLPVRPSVLDLAALPAALALVDAAQVPALLVLSAVPARCAEEPEVRRALAEAGRAVAETTIHDRADFRRALATGRAVAETAPGSPAAREIRGLWRELAGYLHLPLEEEETS